MNAFRQAMLPALIAPWRRAAAAWDEAQDDLEPLIDPRSRLPALALGLALVTIPVVALSAAAELGPGFAFRDVVGLLIGYGVAVVGLSRVPWTRLPQDWLVVLVCLHILFVVSLTTMTGGGLSPYFALYAPVLALAGWHLRLGLVVGIVGLVAVTEVWRALLVDRGGHADQIAIALPFFAALAVIAHLTAGRLSGALATIRRDQRQVADTLTALRSMPADPAADGLDSLVEAVRPIFGCFARIVTFEPPLANREIVVADGDDGLRLSVAVSGAATTYGILEAYRARPFAPSEARLVAILADAWGRALDARPR